MKLRISSCKATAFRKDLTRFAPVWIGWGLFLGLILLTMSDDNMDFWFPSNIASSIQVMGIFTCGYALLTAQMLFGDLFSSRMCNALHAMPLKREHWYGVHVRSGLWFCLIPSTVTALAASLWIHSASTMINGWQIPLYWWAATNLSYLFFFGLAAFSVMCVGSRFAMAAVYGIFNFASVLVMFLVDSLYIPLLHGLITPTARFTLFCPVAHCTSLRFLNCTREETGRTYLDEAGVLQEERIGKFEVMADHWVYLLIIAVLGLALLLLARQMYRKRKLECAGDFVALPALTPVFQVVMTLMVSAAFAALYAMLGGDFGLMALYVAVGLLTGWFATKMLITRSTRVFRPRNWLGLALLTILLSGSLFLTKMDPMGIRDWVPQVSQVKQAQLMMFSYGSEFNTEDPAEIADLLRIHSLALEDNYTEADSLAMYSVENIEFVNIYLTYTLENGTTARRRYYIPALSEEGALAEGYFSRAVCILRSRSSLHQAEKDSDIFNLVGEPQHLSVVSRSAPAECLTAEYVEELLTAIAADCASGTMAQHYAFHEGSAIEEMGLDAYYLDLSLKNGNYLSLHIYPDCVNTLAVLEKTGIPEMLRQNPQPLYG